MRKLFFMLLLAALTSLTGQALNIENTAGGLAQAVNDDLGITTLAVTGTMDARDFQFITNSLDELTVLDLSGVTIEPYSKGKALYGAITDYAGNAIPRTAFFGKKLTSVTLPANLETIGFAAFAGDATCRVCCVHVAFVYALADVAVVDSCDSARAVAAVDDTRIGAFDDEGERVAPRYAAGVVAPGDCAKVGAQVYNGVVAACDAAHAAESSYKSKCVVGAAVDASAAAAADAAHVIVAIDGAIVDAPCNLAVVESADAAAVIVGFYL